MLQPGERVTRAGGYLQEMDAPLEVLAEVTGRLEATGIAYMLSGAMALSFYAHPRMTRDLDLVVSLETEDLPRIVEAFGDADGPDMDELRVAIAERGTFVLMHVAQLVKVDLHVRGASPYRVEELGRRRRIEYGDSPLWIVAPEDLVLSKLVWAKASHSESQLRDVRGVLASVQDLDWNHLERWAATLGVTELLGECAVGGGEAMSRDTTPRAAALFHALMMRKSPGERVRMAASMFASAREVVLSSIRQQLPGISPVEERVQLFRRFYEADLPPAQVERYVAMIRASDGQSAATSGPPPPEGGPVSR